MLKNKNDFCFQIVNILHSEHYLLYVSNHCFFSLFTWKLMSISINTLTVVFHFSCFKWFSFPKCSIFRTNRNFTPYYHYFNCFLFDCISFLFQFQFYSLDIDWLWRSDIHHVIYTSSEKFQIFSGLFFCWKNL